ncbi:ATP/GTP-binding protein [Streptomyces sp. PTM05]|uniref:ATP/GTP-binding protein n=1 Tax=Streptantibioticus parmotrematis TaxID=2873249 RepID=A0ABS7R2S1_9ACTN|nr:ATP/GTP-binding protein [Streptantibioticus parmotrematis]MBY8889231.1 ATP/GTP-binding protein [Streptantibioticus parmotrematis]
MGVSAPGAPSASGGHNRSSGSDAKGGHTCQTPKGTVVPCSDPNWGTFSGGCYYQVARNVPPTGDPAWQGHSDQDKSGKMYWQTCPDDGYATKDVWMPNGSVGAAVDPAQLAQQAVAKMRLGPPQIDISPKPGGRGLVGMPVWMSVAKSATSWGPQSASASAGGVTVTATAVVSQVVWSMGDGHSVTCTSPGTPYSASDGKASSPDCGYQYSQPSSSQPGGTYPVSATATWTIHWAGGGEQGDLTQTRAAQVRIAIAELQVVN